MQRWPSAECEADCCHYYCDGEQGLKGIAGIVFIERKGIDLERLRVSGIRITESDVQDLGVQLCHHPFEPMVEGWVRGPKLDRRISYDIGYDHLRGKAGIGLMEDET